MKKLLITLAFCMLTINLSAQGLLSGLLGSSEPKGPRIKFVEGDTNAKEEILFLKINGVIQEKDDDDSPMTAFKQKKSILDSMKEDLSLAAKRDAVKAVYLEINSPGVFSARIFAPKHSLISFISLIKISLLCGSHRFAIATKKWPIG